MERAAGQLHGSGRRGVDPLAGAGVSWPCDGAGRGLRRAWRHGVGGGFGGGERGGNGVGVLRPVRGSAWRRGRSDGDGLGRGWRPPDVFVERIAGQLHGSGRRVDGPLAGAGGVRPCDGAGGGLRRAWRHGVGGGLGGGERGANGVGVLRPVRGSAWGRGCSDGDGLGRGRRPPGVFVERAAGQLHGSGRRGVDPLAGAGVSCPCDGAGGCLGRARRHGVGGSLGGGERGANGVGVLRPVRGSAWGRGCSDGDGLGRGRRPADVFMERAAGRLHRRGRRGGGALARSRRGRGA